MPLTSSPYQRRVGLLGGSFNPPHEGHREISLAALNRLELDAVWWLVTPGNPLKDPDSYAPIDTRLSRARRTANHPDIVISDFESRHNLQYTVDTLAKLIELNPNVQFIWLMGADSLSNFHRWKNWRRIAELAPIAVFNRPGHEADALDSEAAQALDAFRIDERNARGFITSEPPAWIYFSDIDNPLSSTAIRNNERNPKATPEK